MAVHRKLGSGLRENSYQRDLEVEFSNQNISFQSQLMLEVRDKERNDVLIGYYIPDFIVDQKVVVEIKALRGIDNSHVAQLIGYLAVTGLNVGLILNFGTKSLQKRRIFPPSNIREHTLNRQWLFIPDWLKKVESTEIKLKSDDDLSSNKPPHQNQQISSIRSNQSVASIRSISSSNPLTAPITDPLNQQALLKSISSIRSSNPLTASVQSAPVIR